MKPFSNLFKWLLVSGGALLISACGGGGGGAAAPANANLSDAQGIWRGSIILNTTSQAASTLVLPVGQLWMLFATPGGSYRLLQGSLSAGGQKLQGTAKFFNLDTGNWISDLTLSVSPVAGTSLSLTSSDATQVGAFTSATFVSQRSPVISLAGTWRDDLTAPTIEWTISALGALTGTGTGCDVTGTVTPRVDSAAVADVQFQENCSGTLNTWTGVGLNGSTANSLKLTLVKSDRSKAMVMELLK
jgi:hypothetical protein